MTVNTGRLQAISAATSFKPQTPPLDFSETGAAGCFGSNVFSLSEMRKRLPKPVFKSVKRTIESGENGFYTPGGVGSQFPQPAFASCSKAASLLPLQA